MAEAIPAQSTVQPSLGLIPVGLKEAALDSPTFRATAQHFADQVEIVERWLDGYVKAASKLVSEVSSLESIINAFLAQSTPPAQVSEAVLDHDYTLLAMRRYGEGAREFWQTTLRGVKRYDSAVVDPIKGFLNTELKTFKEARRLLQATQKDFDHVISKYLSQSKTKEASSLREDAFQVHESRKAYLKASMDFCIAAPNLRSALDKLIVRVFSEQWREMRSAREANATMFAKWNSEMERVRGWSREMETSERAFKRELLQARKQIEETAESIKRPSRELDDYAASTVPYLGAGGTSAAAPSTPVRPTVAEKSEKQGWLFIKTTVGRPPRTVWNRRWFFVKNGIFGWLIQGARSGGVEESERTGVLLCSIRPAFQEERRFCFEVKTKDTSVILQAETQQELTEWIRAFEMAKRKALEDPASTDASPQTFGIDPAFAVTPPIAPEFAAKAIDTHGEDGAAPSAERDGGTSQMAARSSFDVSTPPAARRVMSLSKENDDGSDRATRIMQKFDLHKRATLSQQSNTNAPVGGIASLISASHNILPVGPGAPPVVSSESLRQRTFSMPASTLAPSTLANPPAPTSLSHTAVVVSGERGGFNFGGRSSDGTGMPSSIMANLWGSSNWGYVNRLGDDPRRDAQTSDENVTPRAVPISLDDNIVMDGQGELTTSPGLPSPESEGLRHRKTLSVSTELISSTKAKTEEANDDWPSYYPLPLKAQQAQFRILFPTVPRSEKVLLVFRATWNPNEQQEFPGRVYVTIKEIYFYSNHLGLVLITGASLRSITDVTAAPGRDCDYLYLHINERSRQQQDDPRRITIKVFLEPLRLLQRRLNWLVRNANSDAPTGLEEALRELIKMETEQPQRSSSVDSWEDATYDAEDGATTADQRSPPRRQRNMKASLRIDGSLYAEPSGAARTGREVQKFKLPAQPVLYAPQGMQASISRDFNVSAKALFHVMFGDKSAVFQLLYCNRWADKVTQTPWTRTPGAGGHWTRQFSSQDQKTPMHDTQSIDIYNDHLCYVVTNTKVPWKLPYSSHFVPTTKIVITHTAKSRCKLAIFQTIVWRHPPRLRYIKRLIEKQALNSLEADALDLTNVAMDQTAKLGHHSKTNRAIEIFGAIGGQATVPQLDISAVPNLGGTAAATRAKQRRPLSLLTLVADDLLEQMLSSIGWAIDVGVAMSKSVLSLCTAHSLLIALLAFSALYNTFYVYRDSVTWWQERSIGHFMARVGVRPDPMISRAIYLRDIDQLVAPPGIENATMASLTAAESSGEVKTCRTTFVEQLTSSTSITRIGSGTGARLQRTRDSLAQYRHDLLVALRVVNRVEREVVSAEWEDWVKAEGQRCQKFESMLRLQQQQKGQKKRKGKRDDDDPVLTLGEEFERYCSSCRHELAGLGNGTMSLI